MTHLADRCLDSSWSEVKSWAAHFEPPQQVSWLSCSSRLEWTHLEYRTPDRTRIPLRRTNRSMTCMTCARHSSCQPLTHLWHLSHLFDYSRLFEIPSVIYVFPCFVLTLILVFLIIILAKHLCCASKCRLLTAYGLNSNQQSFNEFSYNAISSSFVLCLSDQQQVFISQSAIRTSRQRSPSNLRDHAVDVFSITTEDGIAPSSNDPPPKYNELSNVFYQLPAYTELYRNTDNKLWAEPQFSMKCSKF